MPILRPAIAAAALLTLSAGAAPAADTLDKARIAAGQLIYEDNCRICHSDNPETPSYGPSLVGVVGRKAGSVEGYEYSDAMRAAGFVWTGEALRAWMADNTHFMPGTKMRHVGVTDAAEQDFIIAYLSSISQ
jgi:cytochrome c